MSDHLVGQAMSRHIALIIDCMDEGHLDRETAIKLCSSACIVATGWCDGNEGEVYQRISGHRCGRCLRVFDPEESCYYIEDAARVMLAPDSCDTPWRLSHRIEKAVDDPHLGCPICSDCLEAIISKYTGDAAQATRIREQAEGQNAGEERRRCLECIRQQDLWYGRRPWR